MKIAVYAGSFNPWHIGHQEVLEQALELFDKVIIAIGQNADKANAGNEWQIRNAIVEQRGATHFRSSWRIDVINFTGLLTDLVNEVKANVVVRGLRNSKDFEDEKTLLYNYEDLGLGVPIVYFISSRNTTHISSSSIRAIEKAKAGK